MDNLKYSIRYIGMSNDYRTNRWSVTCEFGKIFEPETTMLSTQNFKCPKCSVEYYANYNAIPPLIRKL